MGELAAFIILSAVILIPGVIVVTSGNIVRSALSLVPTFLGVTGLYIMLQAEFVAGIQVLIYAGAITVLILFVIMLTEGGPGTMVRQAAGPLPGASSHRTVSRPSGRRSSPTTCSSSRCPAWCCWSRLSGRSSSPAERS